MDKKGKAPAAASSNWTKLQKTLPKDAKPKSTGKVPAANPHSERQKKNSMMLGVGRYLSRADTVTVNGEAASTSNAAGPSKVTVSVPAPAKVKEDVVLLESPSDKPLVEELRMMVAGRAVLNEAKKAPGNYIAVDCEMVGLGHLGSESALARVSLVNYHGHVLLDTFVQPREKVTDWRTWISGVRESDLVGAPEFEEVQKQVAELVEGRVLVGHAIDNDLKVMLLSHPSPLIRDTQRCKALREKAKNKHPGLKKLTEMELGIQIQKAAHSSVTDARATMALYRLHKGEWEAQLRHTTEAYRSKTGHGPTKYDKGKKVEQAGTVGVGVGAGGKRKRNDNDDDDGNVGEGEGDEIPRGGGKKKNKKEREQFPGGGRKGISSGLGLIVRRFGQRIDGAGKGGRAGGREGRGGGGGGGGRRGRQDAEAAPTGGTGGAGGKWWEQDAE